MYNYYSMIKKHTGVHPVLYALLQNNQIVSYMRVIMTEMVLDARPAAINCALKSAAFAALKDYFPDVEFRGCVFQVSWLHKNYNSNPEYACMQNGNVTYFCTK